MPTALLTPTDTLANEHVGFHSLEAASTVALDGFTIRDDYGAVVRNYLRENTVLWQLIPKEEAGSDPVTEMQEGPEPEAGFISKIDLNPPETPSDLPAHFPLGTGQNIKAMGGLIKLGHYAQSLYDAQRRPYGDIVARKTNRLLIKTVKTMERGLITGNAANDPLSFNGLSVQIATGHTFNCDVTLGDSVVKKLRGIVRLSINDEDILRGVTHIFCTGLGLEVIEEEVDAKLDYTNLESIRPGLRVPSIITQAGIIPIIPSPYIQDSDNGADKDEVHYWLVDINTLMWKGIYPKGGLRTFDPQVFDVSNYNSNATPYLLEKRMCLAYGTLLVAQAGQGVWKLTAKIPSGKVGGI